ncbi:MAG: excinuclease ABC subunit UvrA [Bacteroidales bacterium]
MASQEETASKVKSNRQIVLKGVKVNNLKNINISFPTNKLSVVTGLSGSGKSSLVFDTLYAEGQRRYVESLSSYARQFLGRMSKPEVDSIEGIAPAIAIEQKTISRNPRSTVGTVTEIYEYIKLLYARIGRIYSPISGLEVKRHSVSNVSDFMVALPQQTKVYILAPLVKRQDLTIKENLHLLIQKGFSRLYSVPETKASTPEESEILNISTLPSTLKSFHGLYLLIDRLLIHQTNDKSLYSRVFDSIQTAFNEGDGKCYLECISENKRRFFEFSNRLEMDGMSFVKPSLNFFSFNNPYGACKACEGLGNKLGVSEELVIPNPNLSVFEEAVACWKGEKMCEWKKDFIRYAEKENFPIHRPYKDLTQEQKKLLWNGGKQAKGIYDCFKFMEEQSYKIQYRVLSSRYKGKTVCDQCHGTRLRPDANYVKINGKGLSDLVLLPISELVGFFENLKLNAHEKAVASRMLVEIKHRLGFLMNVGLPYLTLNRASNTLSGGEAQRIQLANSLGSALVGSLYILDEPSIGLHSKDTEHLIEVIKQLRDLGNTVIVVEHDEAIMLAADHIVDIGPFAGQNGGEVVFEGSPEELLKNGKSLTAKYLREELQISIPTSRRAWKDYIQISGVNQNNLKNVTVKFPLRVLTVVTGVSGSGKTSLVRHTLYPALQKVLGSYGGELGRFDKIEGNWRQIKAVELVDQNPIGRSSRSNPATYIKAFDDIRQLLANQVLAKKRSYTPGYFSFNVEGGRCEACQGEGTIKVEMQFMADLFLECDQCHGKRFKEEVLEITYRGKNVADILEMTVEEAIAFFSEDRSNTCVINILEKIQTLQDVGLGYLHLGQSSNSLSGGEAQRIKLAYFLGKGVSETSTLFIFDEPTTGLHFHDINKLYQSLEALIRKGHTIVVIEHHLDVIKLADWIIDVGPEGGEGGGRILFEGVPEDLVKVEESQTGRFLKTKLQKNGN